MSLAIETFRTSSEPLIQSLRSHMIPFRCAGRTGLFRQPEAAILGKTYAWLVGNPWKSDRYDQSEPVKIGSLLSEFANVFNGGETIPELQERLSRWKKQVDDEALQANLIRDYYRLLRVLRVQDLDLDNPNQAARMGCLARFSEILADFEHVTRRARYVQENGESVFRSGQDGLDRTVAWSRGLRQFSAHARSTPVARA